MYIKSPGKKNLIWLHFFDIIYNWKVPYISVLVQLFFISIPDRASSCLIYICSLFVFDKWEILKRLFAPGFHYSLSHYVKLVLYLNVNTFREKVFNFSHLFLSKSNNYYFIWRRLSYVCIHLFFTGFWVFSKWEMHLLHS